MKELEKLRHYIYINYERYKEGLIKKSLSSENNKILF